MFTAWQDYSELLVEAASATTTFTQTPTPATPPATASLADISPPISAAVNDENEAEDAYAASMGRRGSSHSRKRKEGHIPRPANAFLFFRSAMWAEHKFERDAVRDHREVSRMAGRSWRKLVEEEREPYRQLANKAKTLHTKLYPGYKYAPVPRTKTGKKKARRDAKSKGRRSKTLAEHLYRGLEDEEFKEALKMNMTDKPSASTSCRRKVSTAYAGSRAPAQPPTSPVVKSETMTSPELSSSHDDEPEGFVPTSEIPHLSLSDVEDEEVSS